jgi:hypothetical protein
VKCRSCGSEIADKAIVCYRCGTPTAEPVAPDPPVVPHRRPWALAAVTATALISTVALAGVWPEHRALISVVGGLAATFLSAMTISRWPRP